MSYGAWIRTHGPFAAGLHERLTDRRVAEARRWTTRAQGDPHSVS
jgi:hypothetical protein